MNDDDDDIHQGLAGFGLDLEQWTGWGNGFRLYGSGFKKMSRGRVWIVIRVSAEFLLLNWYGVWVYINKRIVVDD